ncbi:MAG: AAA family ATPase [Reichenbachiella sp.]
MKFKIKNLGAVKSADIELSDLTIISGDNNTGKTYIAYAIYSFLTTAHETIQFEFEDEFLESLIENGQAKLKLDGLNQMWLSAVENSFSLFKEIVPQIFSTDSDFFTNFSLTSDIGRDFKLDELYSSAEFRTKTNIGKKGKVILKLDDATKNFLIISLENLEEIPSFVLGNILSRLIVEEVISLIFGNIYVSPAERLGVSLFYKELDATKNTIIEILQEREDSKKPNQLNPFDMLEKITARYVKPVKDNIAHIRDLEEIEKSGLGHLAKENKAFHLYIEKMVGGRFTAKNGLKFISSKRGDDRHETPLHLASASLRSIIDIYFYIKYQAKHNDLMIIDEPEEHLSPKNQVLMARFIGALTNAGIRVFITTHSDIIIREINNLILLNKNFKDKDKFLKKHYSNNLKFELDCKKIKVFQINDKGKTELCMITEEGIEVSLFDDTIDKLNWINTELSYLTESSTFDE